MTPLITISNSGVFFPMGPDELFFCFVNSDKRKYTNVLIGIHQYIIKVCTLVWTLTNYIFFFIHTQSFLHIYILDSECCEEATMMCIFLFFFFYCVNTQRVPVKILQSKLTNPLLGKSFFSPDALSQIFFDTILKEKITL